MWLWCNVYSRYCLVVQGPENVVHRYRVRRTRSMTLSWRKLMSVNKNTIALTAIIGENAMETVLSFKILLQSTEWSVFLSNIAKNHNPCLCLSGFEHWRNWRCQNKYKTRVKVVVCESGQSWNSCIVIRTRAVALEKMHSATQPAVLESVSWYFDWYVTVT